MKKIQDDTDGGPALMRPCPARRSRRRRRAKGPGLVRVRAAAANPLDWTIRNGATTLMTGRRFPRGWGVLNAPASPLLADSSTACM